MEVRRVADPSEFLDRTGPLLLDDEARHNLILGIAGTLRDFPSVYPEHRLWAVEDAGIVAGAALQTPPFNIVVARPTTAGTLAALVDALHDEQVDVPGVTAATPEVDTFADAWEARSGQHRRERMRQRVYQLTAVSAPRAVPGQPRPATDTDRELLVSWIRAFADEALGDSESPAGNAERVVAGRLGGVGGFVLWEDGEPVSLAGWGGRTPNGVRIGPIYTPPRHRGRGYGSAATAAVSADRLASGCRFCFLYTDLSNPTSNRIYMDVGYEPVCDSVDYAFDG